MTKKLKPVVMWAVYNPVYGDNLKAAEFFTNKVAACRAASLAVFGAGAHRVIKVKVIPT